MIIHIKDSDLERLPYQIENYGYMCKHGTLPFPKSLQAVDIPTMPDAYQILIPTDINDMIWPYEPYLVLRQQNKQQAYVMLTFKTWSIRYFDGDIEKPDLSIEILEHIETALNQPINDSVISTRYMYLESWYQYILVRWAINAGLIKNSNMHIKAYMKGLVSNSLQMNYAYVDFRERGDRAPYWHSTYEDELYILSKGDEED